MELLQALLPSTRLLRLTSYSLSSEERRLRLNLISTQTEVPCPICGQLSHRVHSRYERTLADLTCVEFSLTLMIQVCKFFCPNPDCYRCIFTERFPEVAAPWARKTRRLVERLQVITLALGGQAGARLCTHFGLSGCGSTLLNQLQPRPLLTFETPKRLGVDDFAFRKGQTYGTILVDLETHRPIALLADRKAETLAEWLTSHPGIEIVSRDRSKTYKKAIDIGAPDAIQVADRFHLVKNLSETLKTALWSYRPELTAATLAQHQAIITACPEEVVVVSPMPPVKLSDDRPQRAQLAQERRIEQQKTIKKLSAQQWLQADIAKKVGVSTRTVQRFLAQPDFPEKHLYPVSGESILTPYKQQVISWWNAGIRRTSVLMTLLEPLGYTGTRRTLQRYIRCLRSAQGFPPGRARGTKSGAKVVDLQAPPLTPRRAAYLLVLRPENRGAEETELLEQIAKQHPDLMMLFDLTQEFLKLIRQQKGKAFDTWILKALTCKIQPLRKFAEGLMDDYAAVKAAIMTTVSNGPVEGLNNKLKMLKRQMYGRAGLDLLAKRFILTS